LQTLEDPKEKIIEELKQEKAQLKTAQKQLKSFEFLLKFKKFLISSFLSCFHRFAT
jgi:hypothetical protein